MKEFLVKALAVLKQASVLLIAVIRRVVASLQSVSIDQPRGVLLCIAFQFLVALAVLMTFRARLTSPPTPSPAEAPADHEAQ
jgi:hypothetical protein